MMATRKKKKKSFWDWLLPAGEVVGKVAETALEVSDTLALLERLKRDLSKFRDKTITTEQVLALLDDIDLIQKSLEAIRK